MVQVPRPRLLAGALLTLAVGGALSGCTLVDAGLDAVLGPVVGSTAGTATPAPSASGRSSAISGWMIGGTPSPSPAPVSGVTPTRPAPTLPAVTPRSSSPQALPTVPSPCAVHPREAWQGSVGAVPSGPGTLTVSWMGTDDPSVLGWKVAAESQTLREGTAPAPTWTEVPSGECAPVTTTLTGLTSGTYYVVWLDAMVDTPERDYAEDVMAARSTVVLVP